MKRIILTLTVLLMALPAIQAQAQEVTESEINSIRAAYRVAKEQVELNEHAQEQNVPRSDMEVVSHYVIPGCGPTEEVIHYYFKLDEDPEHGILFYNPYFITRSYNIAARKFYQEYLFDENEGRLLFFYQSNDAEDGGRDEIRYYYGKHGINQSIKGDATVDEGISVQTAHELKNAFNLLMNSDY